MRCISLLANDYLISVSQQETAFITHGWHIFYKNIKEYLTAVREEISDSSKAKMLFDKIQLYKKDKSSIVRTYSEIYNTLIRQAIVLDIFVKNLNFLKTKFPQKYDQWFDSNLINVINNGIIKNLKNLTEENTFNYIPFTLYIDRKKPVETQEIPEAGY